MDNEKTIDNDKIYKNYFFDVINALSTNSKCIKHMKLHLIHGLNIGRARRDLSLPGRRVHLLYFRTEERKKENLVYEKSQ